MERRTKVVAAARGCVGTRFVPQGRIAGRGLDCVGLAAHAFAAAGADVRVPDDYPLRGGSGARWKACVARDGLREIVGGEAGAGDLLLIEVGPRQFHLAVHSGEGFVHAHAGLRRVVETPGAPPWPIVGAWRLRGEEGEG